MIPAGFIQEMLARADIVEVVGRHVTLKKAGINHKGLCPFHGEKSPSFIVSPSRQTYHCFGCGVHGDALRFLMEHTGASFVDAVHDLAQQLGMAVPEDDRSPEERERAKAAKEKQATLGDVLARAAKHYRAQLKSNPRAIDYLKARGLTGEIAARFGLGYAPEGWRTLAGVFPRYDDPLLAESGLVIVQGDEGPEQKRYDRFRDRIMFPIRAVQGDVIGFGGRVLDKGEPKYLNSPETPVFHKGRELYGLHEARAGLREKGYALVVEGYMDVVALAQLGFPNAVATLGTACTAEHVAKLMRFTDHVIFSFDGDAAGRRAAGRALEASLPHATDTRRIRFLFLPPEHDPDSYVREHGAEAFERYVEQAVPLSRQLIEHAGEGGDLDSAEGRARLLANAKPLWSALPDGAFKRQLLGELATLGHLSHDDLANLWSGAPAARAPRQQAQAESEPSRPQRRRSARAPSRATATELDRVLWLLVHRTELWDALDGAAQDLLAGQGGGYGELFSAVERSLHEHGPLSRAALLEDLAQLAEGRGAAVLEQVAALVEPEPQADLLADLRVLVDRMRLAALNERIDAQLASGEPPDRELFRERDELKNRLSAPPAPAR